VLFSSRSRFTDDTVLTVAVADALLHGKGYAQTFVDYVFAYPDAGYGSTFLAQALTGTLRPYNSWGNGSVMRVCLVGFAFVVSYLRVFRISGSTVGACVGFSLHL
jgi:ADP-ribosylglycohydrolase